MTSVQLCRAASRYEMICSMNFNERDISIAAEMLKVPVVLLKEMFFTGVKRDERGSYFASLVYHDEELMVQVLLNERFYEILKTIINS